MNQPVVVYPKTKGQKKFSNNSAATMVMIIMMIEAAQIRMEIGEVKGTKATKKKLFSPFRRG
jgi:hypothetical protein